MNWLRRLFGLRGGDPSVETETDTPLLIERPPTAVAAPVVQSDGSSESVKYEPRDPLLHIGRGVGGFPFDIVGESHYQDALWRVRDDSDNGSKWVKSDFHIVIEPSNPYDPNAIKVVTVEGETVGYFSKTDAIRYKPFVEAASAEWGTLWCRGLLTGGTDERESIGLKLDVLAPKDLMDLLKSKREKAEKKNRSRADNDGEPLGPALNAARRTQRDITEALGLVKGFLADGIVADEEISFLADWGSRHTDSVRQWPLSVIFERIKRATADKVVTCDERADLHNLFLSLTGGTAVVNIGADGASTLPLDVPVPTISWSGSVFVFTGKFAFGPRHHCSAEVIARGGRVESAVTKRTSYLVVGTFGNRDWLQTAYGRKIERAIELRNDGSPIRIVGEDHWASSLSVGV
jgi:hypothetical protein